MGSRISAGLAGGVAAGVVFGIMMQMMVAPTPDGGGMPMMSMIAMILGSTSGAIGWLYHLFNSALIGAIFAWMLGTRISSYGSGLGWGAAYGFAWWILGGLILMPVLLGMSPFAPLMMAPMRGVAVGSLIGHLVYGLILGGLYIRLARPVPRRVAA
jgi:hypothetical protein